MWFQIEKKNLEANLSAWSKGLKYRLKWNVDVDENVSTHPNRISENDKNLAFNCSLRIENNITECGLIRCR